MAGWRCGRALLKTQTLQHTQQLQYHIFTHAQVFYEHMSEEEHTMAEMRDALGEDRLMELGTK